MKFNERVIDLLNNKELSKLDIKRLEEIFPELKESEDERMRKILITYLSTLKHPFFSERERKEILAWLEKQSDINPYSGTSFEYNGHTWGMCARDNGVEILLDGELKAFVSPDKSFIYPIHPQPTLAPKSAMEAIKEEKVEPKFKVGDWVIHTIDATIMQIVNNKDFYESVEISGQRRTDTYNYIERDFRLWTIQDAEDGDILCDSHEACDNPLISILKKFEHVNFGLVKPSDYSSYCFITSNDKQMFKEGAYHHKHNIKPATKEQRDLLFKKMKEAGYEWDAEKKELKKIEQKQWDSVEPVSEEDKLYLMPEEQKPADKVEPKFKVGDWVVQENIGTYKVVEVCESWYEVIDSQNNHYSIGFDKEYMCHLWTIQDAKDGDVLITVYNERPFIYKGCLDPIHPDSPVAYCGIDNDGYFCRGGDKFDHWWTNEKVQPATKEQHDLLFQKIKEAGYEWDAEKKELKKIEQKPAEWSEEDEKMWLSAIEYVQTYPAHTNSVVNWLKSLKDKVGARVQPRNMWISVDKEVYIEEPVLAQKKDKSDPFKGYVVCCYHTLDPNIYERYIRLDKNFPHITWKPSDEQLNNILDVLSLNNCTPKRRELLESLYQDLKNLKG